MNFAALSVKIPAYSFYTMTGIKSRKWTGGLVPNMKNLQGEEAIFSLA